MQYSVRVEPGTVIPRSPRPTNGFGIFDIKNNLSLLADWIKDNELIWKRGLTTAVYGWHQEAFVHPDQIKRAMVVEVGDGWNETRARLTLALRAIVWDWHAQTEMLKALYPNGRLHYYESWPFQVECNVNFDELKLSMVGRFDVQTQPTPQQAQQLAAQIRTGALPTLGATDVYKFMAAIDDSNTADTPHKVNFREFL